MEHIIFVAQFTVFAVVMTAIMVGVPVVVLSHLNLPPLVGTAIALVWIAAIVGALLTMWPEPV